MSNTSENFKGIAYFCGFILLFYIFIKVSGSIVRYIRENPDDAMSGVVLIGVLSYFLYLATKK
jgi:hypothetical protein